MTFGGLQFIWGKLFKYLPINLWYLLGILCSSGVTVGLFSIVGFAAPPSKRPQYLVMVGAVYAIAAVMGLLLGGAFNERLTWR